MLTNASLTDRRYNGFITTEDNMIWNAEASNYLSAAALVLVFLLALAVLP